MTNIEQKAQAMVNGVLTERGIRGFCIFNRQKGAVEEALCRTIEQCEATKQELADFKQKVSDVLRDYYGGEDGYIPINSRFAQFIIPKPKPDPLVDVLLELELSSDREEGQHDAKWIRSKLDALGFEIREKSDAH